MAGAQFGIGLQASQPQSGLSLLHPILQSLQIVAQQLQQLQQLDYVQQQQLQQLQQWIQVVPQQIQQLQQQLLAQQPMLGVPGIPFPASQQFFNAQPGIVM